MNKIIYKSEEDINEYSKKIMKHTNEFVKNKNVHGIYLLTYKDEIGYSISYNFVTDKEYDDLYQITQLDDELDIYFYERSFDNFNVGMFNKESIKACKDLANSIILYDKTGELTELQEKLKENNNINSEYNNLMKFEPSLKLKKVYKVPVKKKER